MYAFRANFSGPYSAASSPIETFVGLFARPSVWLSLCLCLSVCLSLCPSVCSLCEGQVCGALLKFCECPGSRLGMYVALFLDPSPCES